MMFDAWGIQKLGSDSRRAHGGCILCWSTTVLELGVGPARSVKTAEQERRFRGAWLVAAQGTGFRAIVCARRPSRARTKLLPN